MWIYRVLTQHHEAVIRFRIIVSYIFNFNLSLSGIKSQLLVLDDVTIFDKIATWNEAKDICEKRGQLMLTLNSEEKFSVLTNRMSFVGLDL